MIDFTIVIATTLRDSLTKLLESINKSTYLPKKVIISIPKGKYALKLKKEYSFEIIFITKSVGQVAQRISGFKEVTSPLCIQMDDDLTFEENFLERFVKSFIKLPHSSALSSALICDGKPFSVLISPKPPLPAILYFILDGNFFPIYGSITKSGIPLGINPYYEIGENPLVKTEWMTGACVIHRTKNLITEWEYPFKGKAFAEDLMHSQLLKSANIQLYVDRSLNVNLDSLQTNLVEKLIYYIRSRNATYKALKSIPNLKTNFIRYYLFSLTYIFGKIAKKITYCLMNKETKS